MGGIGPRSLAARLLLVLLIPTAMVQVLAYQEVQRHDEAAASATKVSAQMLLLQRSGRLLVPLVFESTTTGGISTGESIGVDRTLVKEATGVDFLGRMHQARAELDAGLAQLAVTAPATVLPSGRTLGDEVALTQAELAAVRAAFDAREQVMADVDHVFRHLSELLLQIDAQSRTVLEQSASTSELAQIVSETEEFLRVLYFATSELTFLAQTGIMGGVEAPVVEMLAAGGALDASLTRFRELIPADRRPEFDRLLAHPSFTEVSDALPSWAASITATAEDGVALIDNPVVIQAAIAVMESSFVRLEQLQSYGITFLDAEVKMADTIRAQAERSQHNAVWAMVGSLAVILVLFALVLVSILRPLRRLVRQSRQVSEGDLAIATSRPTGPTDIRVVMRTFDEMVNTLRAYDKQVRLLAQGETHIDRALPGPLGETLRQSVSRLAAVTNQLHESEAAANAQARTDALTGLSNRVAALERLAHISIRARSDDARGAIIFLDLDGFKSVNDTQGHGEGDRILGEIGGRLRTACPDSMVARIGGDEFIVLIDEVHDQQQVVALARDLIRLVSAPCAGSNGQSFTLSASVGVSIVDDSSREPLDFIARADSAVYHAKERGRGRVEVYDERLARDIEDRADMALTMRQGLAQGQFSLRLQPIIDIASGRPIGAEALVRWNRPGVGEVGPDEFIPVAERTGVIVDLDAWVIEQAMGILREWGDHPLTSELRIAVNISGRHIVDGTLSPLIDHLCRTYGADRRLLDLEITETHLVADVARASTVVDDLRSQGIRVAIDDFGTGYSSMGYLHQLTVDILKIDRVFVAGMCDNDLDRTIVELLLRLGDSLGVKVVAEGVDSLDKLVQLELMGCPWAQGYYIAMPMMLPEATAWLSHRIEPAATLR
ncbi:MAG: sensor domain-containing phosphodiesterase [Actinomycetota bacterium]|nr:sensor domain-containing phosphodiesterase [Actinomycetota bacterium]